jgi:hypothetical protein
MLTVVHCELTRTLGLAAAKASAKSLHDDRDCEQNDCCDEHQLATPLRSGQTARSERGRVETVPHRGELF